MSYQSEIYCFIYITWINRAFDLGAQVVKHEQSFENSNVFRQVHYIINEVRVFRIDDAEKMTEGTGM